MSTLDVELNRREVHAIQAPERFETDDAFTVTLANRGQPTHVHLHLDDALDRVASLDAVNHYVEAESETEVRVATTPPEEPVTGTLDVVTGYGSNRVSVEVRVDPPPTAGDGVLVDEEFNKPPAQPPPPSWDQRLASAVSTAVERGGVPALVLSLVAVALGVAAALAIESVVLLLAAGGAIVVALAATLSLLW